LDQKLSDRFYKTGKEFLNVDYPIICGAMTWISEPNLVAAVANAGGFGCLAGGNTPPDILSQQIQETREKTDKPIGVNLITIAPVYPEHMVLVKDLKLEYVIFAGSFPREREIDQVKATGAKVLCFASTLSIADRMLKYGADALILEGSEAGGHVGHVSLNVLLQQVLFKIPDVPIFVGGGLATGRIAAHMYLMGAAGVQMGTRFAVAKESIAHINFKKRFIKAKAREAISTPQYDSRLPVVAVRSIKNKAHKEFGQLQLDLLKQLELETIHRHDAQNKVEEFWMGALRRAVVDGDIDSGSLMAGQSVGLVDKIEPVSEIMREILEDTETELQRVKDTLI